MRPDPPATDPQSWTTRSLLDWMASAFRERSLDAPRLLAEMLLAHVLGCERLRLYTDADRPATAAERRALRALVSRALRHEPVQYLVGEAWFDTLPFHVDPRVLIPRPSTATLVEALVRRLRDADEPAPRFADVCTGSGCVAVSALRRVPAATAVATDLSTDALDVARRNAERHGVGDRLALRSGDLLDPIAGDPPLRAIAANPPYIPDHEWADVEPNVKDHEPHAALRAGPDGLRFVAPLIEHAPERLAPGGLLAIEIATVTAGDVLRAAERHPGLTGARILEDLEGLPRVLVAERAGG
jgi:release factor glutamine methyltransferase